MPKTEKRHILHWEGTTEMTLNQAAANLRWLVQSSHMNEAWAVNQSSRGFTAQLPESWAYFSPYSAEQEKKTLTLVSSFPRSFFTLNLLPPPRSLSSVMNGRYEFSVASPGFSLRPSAAEQTTRSQLKGAIRNLFEPCTFWVYLCMALKRSRRNMENRFL